MLDDLVREIGTLKSRMNEHREILQGSEAQTRMSLIDPLLKVLGWDTADPALVRPEYNLRRGRADYALLGTDGKPVAIIEAKKLNESLGTEDHRMQMLTYANFSDVSYAGLTDGNQWVFYKVFDQGSLEDRVVLDVSITRLSTYQCALQLLLLWQPNLASGQPMKASEPILGTEPEHPEIVKPSETAVPAASEVGWTTLQNLHPGGGTKPPKAVRFPNDKSKQLSTWKSLLVEVTEWLIADGVLTAAECPIPGGQSTAHYSINVRPEHANGTRFFAPYTLSNGLLLIATGGAQAIISRCRSIVEHLGKDPATVHVQVG